MAQLLHTIGYEGASIVEMTRFLRTRKIELVIDVRELPLSRKQGFSKSALREALADVNIEYVHLRGLGDPKAGRVAARERRYKDFQKIFRRHMLSDAAQVDLASAMRLSEEKLACLLCFEQDHRYCHRCIVADAMAALGDFELGHLSLPLNHNPKRGGHDHVREFISVW